MLSTPSRRPNEPPTRRPHVMVTVQEAVARIRPDTTVAVGWLGDSLATALAEGFITDRQPNGLTIVYAVSQDKGRNHGLNLLAHEGLVRRVVGGQWHPVPALQAMAAANRIEAYSLPAGVINRLFRDIADGLPGHLSRSGLGTTADPRHGGGRLNRRTREQLVRLVRPAGEDALLFHGFPIDAALIGVAFMAGSGELAMTRDAMTMARAARRSGGVVVGQANRIGTLDKLPPGQVVVPDNLVDVLVPDTRRDRNAEMITPAPAGRWSDTTAPK